MIGEICRAEQSKEGIFLDKGYREGQVFKRKDCLDYDLGHSTYSGEYYDNYDGIVMKFNDGKEVLSDFCELISFDCPDSLWAVTKDIERIEISAKEKINKIIQEYNKLKTAQ
jgi:hypothetical protein